MPNRRPKPPQPRRDRANFVERLHLTSASIFRPASIQFDPFTTDSERNKQGTQRTPKIKIEDYAILGVSGDDQRIDWVAAGCLLQCLVKSIGHGITFPVTVESNGTVLAGEVGSGFRFEALC